MYINEISIFNFRTFRKVRIDFLHPDLNYQGKFPSAPKYPNVNLVLGNNGMGKTTLLKAVALAALGPAVGDSGLYPYHFVRLKSERNRVSSALSKATIRAKFLPHPQDKTKIRKLLTSRLIILRRAQLESMVWLGKSRDRSNWQGIFKGDDDSFFFVGYGASRRVDPRNVDPGERKKTIFPRAQRVQGLFEDGYTLIPFTSWLPPMVQSNPGRYKQVLTLINELLPKSGGYSFAGHLRDGEFLFEREGLKIPFPALSDGYRAYLGWIGDLLYHVCMTCPRGMRLDENKGIVMVDEIDLHLHPEWQLNVLPTMSRALPNLQFIITSHSPLVVGSLEWMNIIVMKPGPDHTGIPERIEESVSGLDADQILLTEYFGLKSTRTDEKENKLKNLALSAHLGDLSAAKELMRELNRGADPTMKSIVPVRISLAAKKAKMRKRTLK